MVISRFKTARFHTTKLREEGKDKEWVKNEQGTGVKGGISINIPFHSARARDSEGPIVVTQSIRATRVGRALSCKLSPSAPVGALKATQGLKRLNRELCSLGNEPTN